MKLPDNITTVPINPIRPTKDANLNVMDVFKDIVNDVPNATTAVLLTSEYDDFVIFNGDTREIRITKNGYKKYCARSQNQEKCYPPAPKNSNTIKLKIRVYTFDADTGKKSFTEIIKSYRLPVLIVHEVVKLVRKVRRPKATITNINNRGLVTVKWD